MRIYASPAYVSLIFFIARIEHPLYGKTTLAPLGILTNPHPSSPIEHPLHGKTTMKPLGILTTSSPWPLFLDTWRGEARMLTDAMDRSNNGKKIFQQRRVVLLHIL